MQKRTSRIVSLFLALLMLLTIAPAAMAKDAKPTLRVLCLNNTIDYNTYPTALILEEATGYHVEYDMLPADNTTEKLNLIIASQEPYDVIIIGGNNDLIMNYAKAGALLDLNPYLENMPRLSAAINEYERETFTIDDKLYAIGMQSPAFDGRGQINNTVFIRQDYLDALNLSMPATLDEFTEMLRAFKNFDNGTGNPTIPLTLTSSNIFLDSIIGAFDLPNEWNEVDGELVHRATDERLFAYLNYMKGLYQEGLIDVDYPANKSSNVYEKFSTGIAASAYLSCYNYSNFGDGMKELQPESKISYLAPVTGKDGIRGIGVTAGGMDRVAFIPVWCENVEAIMDWMELKLEPALFKNVTIGVEGVHYTVDENGERWPVLPVFTNERGQSDKYYTGRPAEEFADYWMLRVKKRADIWEAWSYMNLDPAFADCTVVSNTGYAPSFESSEDVASLNALLSDMCLKIIAGDSTTDDYAVFLTEWMNEGGERMIEEYNTWWDDYQK